jgi:hypothetical protein
MPALLVPYFVLLTLSPAGRHGHSLNGSYTLQPELSGSVTGAVDSAVAKMNFIIRPIARRRLVQTNRPSQGLRISLSAVIHEIQFDARSPIRTPADGRAIPWTREDGEQFMLRTTLESTDLVQRFEAADGVKTIRYDLIRDHLRMRVTVESPKLLNSLNYTLVYRRTEP